MGHGYATEAAGALLSWAFRGVGPEPGPGRDRHTRNVASARVLEKLGFDARGTLREDCVVDGEVSDPGSTDSSGASGRRPWPTSRARGGSQNR